jgi:hypothetical protein
VAVRRGESVEGIILADEVSMGGYARLSDAGRVLFVFREMQGNLDR